MVDLEGNVGETISRYHDHMNENSAITICDVHDVGLTSLGSSGGMCRSRECRERRFETDSSFQRTH
jgi:hypothetical protein